MPDAIARLMKFKQVRKLHVRVAGLDRLKAFEGDNQSVNGLINIAKGSKSPVVELELSAGLKRKESVDKAGVINTIKGLMGLPANVVNVEKIDVRGRVDEDMPIDHLRLLDFVMTEKGAVASEKRRVPYHSRAQALRDAFKRRKPELEKMFGQPGAGQ
jgi:hypothetical protein